MGLIIKVTLLHFHSRHNVPFVSTLLGGRGSRPTYAQTLLQHAVIEMEKFLSVNLILLEVILILWEMEVFQPGLNFFHGPLRDILHLVESQLLLFFR